MQDIRAGVCDVETTLPEGTITAYRASRSPRHRRDRVAMLLGILLAGAGLALAMVEALRVTTSHVLFALGLLLAFAGAGIIADRYEQELEDDA